MYPHITVREALAHFAGFYPHPRDVDEVIALSGLQAKADERTRRLSGGQQRRLDFALALIGDPDLVFLDEPTTGFDPAARRAAWDTIRALRDLGKTVLLTTHYLDEAQSLADRVAIIKDGRILAAGSPAELGVDGAATYRVSWRDEDGERREREIDDPTAFLHELTGEALARGEQRARPRRRAPEPRGRVPAADRRQPARRSRRPERRRGARPAAPAARAPHARGRRR